MITPAALFTAIFLSSFLLTKQYRAELKATQTSMALDPLGSLSMMQPEEQSGLVGILDNSTQRHPAKYRLERQLADIWSDAMTKGSFLNISRAWPRLPFTVPGPQTKRLYTVQGKMLSKGAFGYVHMATVSKRFASKELRATYAVKLQNLQPDLLRTEFELCSSIQSPYVVQVYDFATDGDWAWMAMEYVKGFDFFDGVVEKNLGDQTMETLLKQMAQGLDAIHAKNIVHLDIKLENIMISEAEPMPKWIDFGLARKLDSTNCKEETVKRTKWTLGLPPKRITYYDKLWTCTDSNARGTKGYKAPEVWRYSYSKKSDVFSLGVVFYSAVCKYFPFKGKSSSWNGVPNTCSTPLYRKYKSVIKKMLIIDPWKRASLEDVLEVFS